MKNLTSHYTNATAFDVQVKTQSGKVYNVPSQTSRSADKNDLFVKRRFENGNWNKL